MMDELDELELRVGEKWAAAAAARIPQDFDLSHWSEVFDLTDLPPATPLPPDWPQFPREQWLRYPVKRQLTLVLCENLLDRNDELTDEQWMLLCLMMQYGGKVRIA
ncbi:hypothetical protein [Mycobacterium sp. IS-836]|uniref:hypothetical protein n=1 Tax=Mycobacterium sp. IS-836 TaxID=1834160 RepID=UPI00114F9028|nr:hypothetical protein [Mycobacterium sp. IS-836]